MNIIFPPKCGKCSRAYNYGFTLMEMMMVVAIMGILLGGMLPALRPFTKQMALKDCADKMQYIMRYSRSVAIHRSTNVTLQIPQGNGEIQLIVESTELENAGSKVPEPLPVSSPNELIEDIKISQVTIMSLSNQTATTTGETHEVTFASDGSTSDTFIYLTDRYENVYTVGIVGLTGQVLLWDHAAENFYETEPL